ncbi:MAG: PVC-type heme-binding CxxCH protein, partial [Pirellulaceae bacterium]
MKLVGLIFVAVAVSWSVQAFSQHDTDARFRPLLLDETFQSEGATAADINGDGVKDIVSGPYWYAGPDFRKRHRYAEEKQYSINAYSDHFFSFAADFNEDGRVDILSIPIPGGDAVWYQNPGGDELSGDEVAWQRHLVLKGVDNESPLLTDFTGDGRAELVCIHQGEFGYASPERDEPKAPWKFKAISKDRNLSRFTHGLGVGDIDGDGRLDLLESTGWWQQPADESNGYRFHEQRFAKPGGSQIFAYDFDGDGDNDVVSVQNAHARGLSWFERRGKSADDFLFVEHPILGSDISDNPYGITLSQMHALGLADIDGDGVMDIVTGKRYFAHGGKDPGAFELPMLLWLRTVRGKSSVEFQPHIIHLRSGVGTQVTLDDVDDNGHIDIIVGNKLGTFVSLNTGQAGSGLTKSVQPYSLVGTDQMSLHVRETPPLSPAEELATFVLPDGFEAQLVAAEPDIAKPMNMAFDSRGRLWVSSSEEYPYAAQDDEQPKDTIKILEDTTGDGYADQVTTFADGLNIPIGLYPYRNGVICFSIPNIWFLQDTDGDGRADKRDILYGPMDTSRDTHGMCNAFTLGFDGWLYACHGFNNQTTVAGSDGNEVTMHSGNTFRMRLDGSRIEHFTHGQVNPFGMAFGPDGDLFTADCHTKPVSLLLRGGYYPSFGKPHDGVGFVPDVMQHLHSSTGIGGIALYNDDKFPKVFQGNTLGGNVMTGRVNRNSLRHEGSTVIANEEPDFLVSGDPWFRPVDLQLGPDGALYIADFYNCIIGHYEVPLTHPSRDRSRGRIWRIVYTGSQDRRDTAVNSADAKLAITQPAEPIFMQLGSKNLTRRMAATEALIDDPSDRATFTSKHLLTTSKNPEQIVQLAWLLSRRGQLNNTEILRLAGSTHWIVRTHTYRIIEEQASLDESLRDALRTGLNDPDARVCRAAVMASTKHRQLELIQPLLDRYANVAKQDLHLRHAIKMSIRDHLSNEEWFAKATKQLPADQLPLVAELCLAIKSPAAGEFLVDNLNSIDNASADNLAQYLTFAARYAKAESLESVVKLARIRFANDPTMQRKLIGSMRDGIMQRGEKLPPVLKNWAQELVANQLGIDVAGTDLSALSIEPPIVWSEFPHPDHNDSDNCWSSSTKRRSSDGQENTLLHSSFPGGEQRTGILRSDAFSLPKQFQFYIAGHDGHPDAPMQEKNLVRICDSATGQVLNLWSPPRNDTAMPIVWETGDGEGRRVYVELVDGDTSGAYAWLAVGRFSLPGLNPSHRIEDWRVAAEITAQFQLQRMRHVMVSMLQLPGLDPTTSVHVAQAIVATGDSSQAVDRVLADSLSIRGLVGADRAAVIQAIIDRDEDRSTIIPLMQKVMS